MSLELFLQAIKYKITDGSDWNWNCYGVHTHVIDSIINDKESGCVFDTETQEVYQIYMIDEKNDTQYIWFNPLYRDAYFSESYERKVNPLGYTEDTEYYELLVLEDIIEKLSCFYADKEYDTNILVPIDIDDDLYAELTELALTKNVTVEELISSALIASVEKYAN